MPASWKDFRKVTAEAISRHTNRNFDSLLALEFDDAVRDDYEVEYSGLFINA